MGTFVRVLGITTLACGCLVGRYMEVATSRELRYVEKKGLHCASHAHRRNHVVAAHRQPSPPSRFGSDAG